MAGDFLATMRRRVGRARVGSDRLGDLLVSPPTPCSSSAEGEGARELVAPLRSVVPFFSPRRCPYLKAPVMSSVALVVAVMLVLTGSLCLNGLGGSLQPDVAAGAVESHADVSEVVGRQDRPRRGKRSKQKAMTSSFRHDRAVGARAGSAAADSSYDDDLQVSSWVWLSQAERERGFSLTHATPDGLQAEVVVLPAEGDECAEGWAGDSCLECAPGFGGDFCSPAKPQADIYNYQVNVPATAEVHLRDYLPPVSEPRVRGSPVFSAGVSIAQASGAAV